jgi:hypothetical protein
MKLFALIDTLLLAVLRVARAVLGLALFAGAMALALVVALAVLLWALLRGRRPVAVHTVWRQAAARHPFGKPGAPRAPADVVDVDAREVPAEVGQLRR